MSKDTGGPAFPVRPVAGSCGGPKQSVGISMRDYFAAKALANYSDRIETGFTSLSAEECDLRAQECYAMADAMLAERAK